MRSLAFAKAASFDCFAGSERDYLCSYFGTFLVGCVDGAEKIISEQNPDSCVAAVTLSLIMVNDFATAMSSSPVDVVTRFSSQLESTFGEVYFVTSEEEHCALRDVYVQNQEFHAMLDEMTADAGFHDAWVMMHSRFPKMCEFAVRFGAHLSRNDAI